MQKYRTSIKEVLKAASYTGLAIVEANFVDLYVMDSMPGYTGTIRHTLLPGAYETADFQKALSDYVTELNRRKEIVIQNAKDGLSDVSDGSESFRRIADFVEGQLKAMSFEPKTEAVAFATEAYCEALMRRKISAWKLRMGNFDCADAIHAWCNWPSLPEAIKDLVNGLRACFFMQFEAKHAHGRFQHLHATHGKKWLEYCDVLESLSSEARMEFAMRVSSLLKEGKRSDDAIFEELCKAQPDLAQNLKVFFKQPMRLFKNDSIRMPDLFF